ncbi:MAG: DUF4173 domain-containing protein [Clostridium sp.]|nr:DUF4173 domain-containing protein [Clostridium sp.]
MESNALQNKSNKIPQDNPLPASEDTIAAEPVSVSETNAAAEPVNIPDTSAAAKSDNAPGTSAAVKPARETNSHFTFMGIGSLVYALFYTFFLYRNTSGITYPFFAGGTCLFFFFYLKKLGITAKKFSIFPATSILLLGISTCLTASPVLISLNKLGIFFLFFILALHNLYEDSRWDLPKYLGTVISAALFSVAYIFHPFFDFSDYRKARRTAENKPEGKGKYVFFGLLIACPLLFVILLLLSSADAVFSNIFERIFSLDFDFSKPAEIFFLFLFAFFTSYAIMSKLSARDLKEDSADKRTAEPVMGITFTGLIALVYLVFCYIQVVYLFGGLGSLPENYTYSAYAREGFFQLVFVCLINLALVLVCLKRFRENKILKGILTFISVCTYIMIASSVYRMLLYIEVYFLTFLRVFVLWALLVIFLLMTGALILIHWESFPFTRYCFVCVTLLYLCFSFARPDYFIAKYNLSQSQLPASQEGGGANSSHDHFNDFHYLSNLSLDAAPVIFEKADELGYGGSSEWWFTNYGARIVKKSYDYQTAELNKIWVKEGQCIPKRLSPRKWNLSQWRAQNAYTRYYKSHPEYAQEIEYDIMTYASDFYRN